MRPSTVLVTLVVPALLGLLAPRSAADTPRTVALVTDMPSTKGTWAALAPPQALKLAAGTILQEYAAASPQIKLLDWTSTAGTSGIVRSGLYIFQADKPWKQWRELIEADAFVRFEVSRSGQFTIQTHTSEKSTTGGADDGFSRPKEAIALLVKSVFRAAGVELGDAAKKELADPETRVPKLFLEWGSWIGHTPNMYNDNPWAGPNRSAAEIITADPNFVRGMAWALTMRLKPVMARSGTGAIKKRPANPVDFDTHVLALLDTRYAHLVIPGYRARLTDPHLLRDSLKILAASEIHFEPADAEEQEDDLLGVGEVKAARAVKTTPLIRRNVCLALSGHKHPKALETVLTVVAVDETPLVREAAAEALGGWPERQDVVDALDRATTEDKEAGVRLAAFRSLTKLKSLDDTRLRRALNDESAALKSYALSQLAHQQGFTPEVRKLVRAAMEGDDSALRVQALQMAEAVFQDGKELVPIITDALKREAPEERRVALRLVRHYGLKGMQEAVDALLEDKDGPTRAQAVRAVLSLDPGATDALIGRLARDPEPGVQEQLARAIGASADRSRKSFVQKLLQSPHERVRHAASDAMYRIAADDRTTMTRSMLADPVMRVNFAAVRLIRKLGDESLYKDLVWATEHHGNEYVRTRALKALDQMDHPVAHDLALRLLESPYWVVRLHAADVLCRRAIPEDKTALERSLQSNADRWLKLSLEDALAKGQGRPMPERTRLGLGKREYLEGGELPNGWQLWQGYIPEEPAEARRLVDEGYRFGRVLSVPKNSALWSMFSWEDTKGRMNAYLLHFRQDLPRLEESAPYLNHVMLFDEPHGLFGGWATHKIRAFLLECGRPDLLGGSPDNQPKVPPGLQRAYRYWSAKVLGELSNFIVGMCRMTLGRQYPDLKWFPQTMTHYGMGTTDAFDAIDADGDFSWRYDNNNLMGHYSKTGVIRAIRPGWPQTMVTWMGWIRPAVISLDRVFTDTKYPDGPWRPRHYMGTRAALALYAGGVEAGYFNHVGYDPISARGKDIGGLPSFPRTPFSKELTDTINNRMLRGDRAYWARRYKEIEGQVTAEQKPVTVDNALDEREEEEEDVADFLAEAEGEKRIKVEDIVKEKYEAERQKHFMNAMVGCSWMNIFNCDVTRAMANLPRPDRSARGTLLILSRGTNWNRDAATFVMPAVALADGFDVCPTYDCMKLVDLSGYDTIMLLDGVDGVTSALVRKINEWLKTKERGLLYVCGDVNTRKALFPELTFERLEEKFLWEGKVVATAGPKVMEEVKDRRGRKTGRKRRVPARIGEFQVAGESKKLSDQSARLRFLWKGDIEPLVTHDAKPVLAQWQAPAEVKSFVVFDGVAGAGPTYTEALEGVLLALDRKRGARVSRNRYWGHVICENEQFVVDVATSGYRSLQAARPRERRGVDIITGVINPTVRHNECALILRDYVGPYAGGKGDWAVMAASELKEMTLVDERTLRVHARGVTRVTHIGEQEIVLKSAEDFEKVENQLDVWERMWKGENAFSLAKIEGGYELHFSSDKPVEIVLAEQ